LWAAIGTPIVEKFNIVYDGLVQKKSELEEEIAKSLEVNLNGIFNFIRLQGNESCRKRKTVVI
jgi:hypothetical protein